MSTDTTDPSTTAPQESKGTKDETGQTMLKLKITKAIDTNSASKPPLPSKKRSRAKADPTDGHDDSQLPPKKKKKSTTIKPKAKSPKPKQTSRGKDKQPRISQAEILDDFFDMSGWLPPNSPGNASSMWRPNDKVREQRVALGESVMRVVERERAEGRGARKVEREKAVERERGGKRDRGEKDEEQAEKAEVEQPCESGAMIGTKALCRSRNSSSPTLSLQSQV
ncbi:hypothetical protein Slin15195_G108180 [Septoria linicola]|uniref:Uncharacterized protein n=1 Tax=Septoria linicola TaxID=215465 RepID=A0A9Q9AY15_9PEZI|nr:hypothetical protein Slin15195_G108180 [Septoria linicola]